MAEKKVTKKVAAPKEEAAEKKAPAKKVAEKKAPVKKVAEKKAPAKKVAVKKVEVVLNAESVGFKAGDVYQALATTDKALAVKEIAKAAKISEEEVLVGMGWLFKEGKIKGEDNKFSLA